MIVKCVYPLFADDLDPQAHPDAFVLMDETRVLRLDDLRIGQAQPVSAAFDDDDGEDTGDWDESWDTDWDTEEEDDADTEGDVEDDDFEDDDFEDDDFEDDDFEDDFDNDFDDDFSDDDTLHNHHSSGAVCSQP